MATLLNPFIRALDANADSVSGALLYIFEAGTTTPVTTYSDSALTTAQAHPLVANSAGEFAQSFVESGTYKIRVADASAVVLYENDHVRMADRPDEPVFFNTDAAVLADTATYADGTYIKSLLEGRTFIAAASGATDYDETNAGGQKLYRRFQDYATVSAFLASNEPTRAVGEIWPAAEFSYQEAASGATDHHVENVSGVKFYVLKNLAGAYPVAAFGEISATDNATLCETVAGKLVAGDSIVFPVGDFPIGQAVDFDVPQDTTVLCWGTTFRCTHDGIAWELNSGYTPADASPATKRRVHIYGGQWHNENVSKTASEAIRAYGMRSFVLHGVKFASPDFGAGGGFHKAVVISAKDTYTINDCYFFDNDISVYIPAIGARTGDRTIEVAIRDCHFSVAGKTNAILCEDNILNFKMDGGSVNGACADGQILFKDNSLIYSEGIIVTGTHFEEQNSAGSIVFNETNGNGFYNVSIKADFVSSVAGHKCIVLDYCRGAELDGYFRDGSGGATETAIEVDANSRDVKIHHGGSFSANPSKFQNYAAPITISSGARKHISGVPSSIMLSEAVSMAGFTGSAGAFSTASETVIDMDTKITTKANWPLPPVGYFLSVAAADSGSSASGGCFAAIRNGTGAGSDKSGIQVGLEGVPNNVFRQSNGVAPCDTNGDISYRLIATGASTMALNIVVNGAVF